MDPIEFHDYVIKPTLDQIGLDQPGAGFLVLGTALIETNLTTLRQPGNGIKLGVYQMDSITHDDIWWNWLNRRTPSMVDLGNTVLGLAADWPTGATQMVGNLQYATAMARCLYRRRPEPLPMEFDIASMALYWKTYWDTFQPEQTHQYISGQLARFEEGFPALLLERERG